MGGVAER